MLVDRLWPRGLRKENVFLTLWLKEIAPSPDLRKWFGHDPARWAEFSRRYRAELARNDEAVAKVADLAKRGPLSATPRTIPPIATRSYSRPICATISRVAMATTLHRPVCALLGCAYPIVLAGMGGVAPPQCEHPRALTAPVLPRALSHCEIKIVVRLPSRRFQAAATASRHVVIAAARSTRYV